MATTTRAICTVCFESFQRDQKDETVCASCRRRATPGGPARELAPMTTSAAARAHRGRWAGWRAEVEEWCRGRSYWVRLPLWLYFAYVFVRHWIEPTGYRSIFDAINLGIHELGHYLFRPLGEVLTIAGGSITQCLAPVVAALVLRRQRDHFGVTVCVAWLATNLWEVAVYVGDSRALQLPLVAPGMGLMPPGDGGLHDWNNLLGRFGLLQHDQTFAWALRLAASATMLAGLGLGAWLLVCMARSSRRTRGRR